MKSILLWWIFIKRNIIPIVITSLLLILALFIMVTYYGKYRYVAYARDIMINSNLQNGGYYMILYNDELFADPIAMETVSQTVKKQILDYAACKYILTTDSFVDFDMVNDSKRLYNCFFYDKNMISGIHLFVDEGRWMDPDAISTEAVICGNAAQKSIGETIVLNCGLEIEIVGIIDDIPLYPSFGRFSNTKIPASSIFENGDMILLINQERVPKTILDSIQYNYRIGNCYIVFDENATNEEQNSLLDFLESAGRFAAFKKIISDSNEQIDKWLYKAFPLPIFLIMVCSISVICICMVVVNRSMNEYSRYYLMGCTKNRCIFNVTMPLIVVFGMPCILNIINIICFPHFLRAGDRYPAGVDYIMDYRSILLILTFFSIIMIPIIIMPRLFYRNYSPLLLYRRNM